ncbi:MAG: undecaprenyl/decaprenyl-phosphate alpha-N-acetylglucosaminyl 1-phosphate transferase [Sedimentisphaerales bacterium]|nr:undecaprenyl/decaprenyl-phosphate alpha-N-acetylglucosaminyl 1-phosphate transferase [Sedimentisphaerales bacterium]
MNILAMLFGSKHSPAEILAQYWPIFPVAFLVAIVATPLCRKFALRFNIVDLPDQNVKTHSQPTAYLGGIGILLGLLAGLTIGFYILLNQQPADPNLADTQQFVFSGRFPDWLILSGVALGAIIACIVGVLDDIYDIRPRKKFLGQALAAAALVAVGIRPNLNQLFQFVGFELHPAIDFFLGIMIVLFFILGATNSLNLLDGLDGLCAGVTAIITIAFFLLAWGLASWEHSPVGDPVRLILCLALVGATLGFLPMNRHPARIFMGDAGSMLLGFVAGTLMLLFAEKIGSWTVGAVVIFGLPILDTAVALVRRFINKKPLFVSDRGHIYDQLMDRGNPLKTVVAISYGLAALYALTGILVSQLRFRHSLLVFLIVVATSAAVVWRGGFLKLWIKNEPKNP